MTFKQKFINYNKKLGYEVEELGKMIILRKDNYRAIHFFNADGSRNKNLPPHWTIDR